ncbi:MAG: agmatine deiminase family protein [Anaerolineae bacterium]|nr:agmatine deiminase family protein [Phycisphaerae bacterium]
MERQAFVQFLCESLEMRQLLSATLKNMTPSPAAIGLPRLPDEDFSLSPSALNLLPPPSAPPSGPIDPVAEYEPMEGLVISWMSYTSILGQITKRVTDVGGRAYIGVTSATVQNSATSTLNGLGVNMSNVSFFTVALNSVWARDYGPRYVYEGNVRVIADHKYNRARPSDDLEPYAVAQLKRQQIYEMGLNGTQLTHGGGNFHLNATGDAYATRLITQENLSFTESQIQLIYQTYQGDNLTLTNRFPTNIDSTGHIDMWMQIYGDKKVFISDWPNNSGSAQDVICDNTATLMQSRGYEVTRLNAYSVGGTHYTFANMVVFNNIVLLPQYNNGPGAAVSNAMFANVQAAVGPGKTVYQINADAMITAAGAFHCIVQHVPMHKGLAGANGGLAPTVYLRGPNNGETFIAGQQYNIQWISDDDAPVAASGGVTAVDILLSTDGGQTFNATIASNQPALGSFNWTIPAGLNTSQARLRVLARDGLNNAGGDDSDANFTISIPVANGVWTGAGDGINWANANNWSNNVVPGVSDDVIIDIGSNPTIEVTGAQSVHTLSSREALHISGSLAVTGANNVVELAALSFDGGTLDLNDNDLILDYTGDSPLAASQMQIAAGAIFSSIAQSNPLHNTTLGAMEATDYRSIYGPAASFDNVAIDDSAVLIKYTYFGDTDFNGLVDFDDYSRADAGFNNNRTGWLNGDFDGNGIVDFDDYSLIDQAFNTQGVVL